MALLSCPSSGVRDLAPYRDHDEYDEHGAAEECEVHCPNPVTAGQTGAGPFMLPHSCPRPRPIWVYPETSSMVDRLSPQTVAVGEIARFTMMLCFRRATGCSGRCLAGLVPTRRRRGT